MWAFSKKRRFENRLAKLAETLCPEEKGVHVALEPSLFADFPKATLEYAMAELFVAHRACALGIGEERVKVYVLNEIDECFLRRFSRLALRQGLDGERLQERVELRFGLYDAALSETGEADLEFFVSTLWSNMAGGTTKNAIGYVYASNVIDHFTRSRELLSRISNYLVIPEGVSV